MTRKDDGYTIALASGTEVRKLMLQTPDGETLLFRLQVPNDKIKSLRMQKFQSFDTDEQVLDYMVELLHKAADEGVSAEQIRSALTHEETTTTARAQLMDLLVNGRITDPKTHALLLEKLTAALTERLVAAI